MIVDVKVGETSGLGLALLTLNDTVEVELLFANAPAFPLSNVIVLSPMFTKEL